MIHRATIVEGSIVHTMGLRALRAAEDCLFDIYDRHKSEECGEAWPYLIWYFHNGG